MGQIDRSGSSPIGVTNTHLDSKGYYFANGVNIIPGQNMPLDSITREQAQDILRSEIINYINSEDLIALQKIANQSVFNVPTPTRVSQVLISKIVNGKLVAAWDDLANVLQTSSALDVPLDNDGTDIDVTGIFTRLINASYTAINKYDENNHLTPKDTSKPYGGNLYLYENAFEFKFNLQNDSIIFKTSTGADITFKKNFDGTMTITDGSQEPVTLVYEEDVVLRLDNGYTVRDIEISYTHNGWARITPKRLDPAKGRKLTSMVVNGSAPTIFYTETPW